ncbi:IS3 family transposase [Mucilaginibacter antarcticus]|uniref:IS3 family transposase n=1 Tax=Mucilaginibacter antarcticus TaxID=1855725 RepID=A0ABW5XVZ9_9SPHI
MQRHSRGLRELCGLLGYSTQAYYQYNRQTEKRAFTQEALIQQIMEHRRLQPRIGTRKLLALMQPEIGRDAFFELLRDNGLLVRRTRYRVRTTFSSHRFRKYPDLVRDMVAERPGQLWVSDITYIRIKQGFAYLSLVTDAYSRKIIGFSVSHDLSTDSCLKALRMALTSRLSGQPLIHHSDRGTQYCSQDYTRLLKSKGIAISMTQSGNPRDNAIAERVNGILKMELLKENYDNINIAHQSIKQAISIYNNLRPHSSIDMLTPEIAHRMTGTIKRKWKNYYPEKNIQTVIV